VGGQAIEFDAVIKKVPDIDGAYFENPFDVEAVLAKNVCRCTPPLMACPTMARLVRMQTPGHILGIRRDSQDDQ